jgi:hypothetical protein
MLLILALKFSKLPLFLMDPNTLKETLEKETAIKNILNRYKSVEVCYLAKNEDEKIKVETLTLK